MSPGPQNHDNSSHGATERQTPVAAASEYSHVKSGKDALQLDAAPRHRCFANDATLTLLVDTSAPVTGAALDVTPAAPPRLSLMGGTAAGRTGASLLPSLNSARPELAALSMLSGQNSFSRSLVWGPSSIAMDQLSMPVNSQSGTRNYTPLKGTYFTGPAELGCLSGVWTSSQPCRVTHDTRMSCQVTRTGKVLPKEHCERENRQ